MNKCDQIDFAKRQQQKITLIQTFLIGEKISITGSIPHWNTQYKNGLILVLNKTAKPPLNNSIVSLFHQHIQRLSQKNIQNVNKTSELCS